MNRNTKKPLIPILIAAVALAAIALIVIFAVIRPLNAQSKKTQSALEEIAAATPKPTAAPKSTPAPTPEPPWTIQIMREYAEGGGLLRVEERDPEGRLVAEQNEDIARREYVYNEAGLPVKITDFRQDGTIPSHKEYLYDAEGRELEYRYYSHVFDEISLFEGRRTTYDEHGNRHHYEEYRKGVVTRTVDCKNTYDGEGRLKKSVSVDTDAADEQRKATETTTYRYDDAGNLLEESYAFTVRSGDGNSSGSSRKVYEYDADHKLVRQTEYLDGHEENRYTYIYDKTGLLLERLAYGADGGELKSRAVQYDANGERIDSDFTYEYDAAGRLLTVTGPHSHGSSQIERTQYTYDEQGRLLRSDTCWINPELRAEDQSENPNWKPLRHAEYEYVY